MPDKDNAAASPPEPQPGVFDLAAFRKGKFRPRTAEVRVAALAAFFPPGSQPVFTVRGLDGEEMARVREATARNRNLAAVIAAMAAENDQEKIQGIRDALGLAPDQITDDLANRIEQLHLGCVSPALEEQDAVKLFRVAPVAGYELTNKILALSGQGMQPGE